MGNWHKELLSSLRLVPPDALRERAAEGGLARDDPTCQAAIIQRQVRSTRAAPPALRGGAVPPARRSTARTRTASRGRHLLDLEADPGDGIALVQLLAVPVRVHGDELGRVAALPIGAVSNGRTTTSTTRATAKTVGAPLRGPYVNRARSEAAALLTHTALRGLGSKVLAPLRMSATALLKNLTAGSWSRSDRAERPMRSAGIGQTDPAPADPARPRREQGPDPPPQPRRRRLRAAYRDVGDHEAVLGHHPWSVLPARSFAPTAQGRLRRAVLLFIDRRVSRGGVIGDIVAACRGGRWMCS